MRLAFFVSSVGDTDLATATISQLVAQGLSDQIFLIPLTTTAAERTKNLATNPHVSRILLDEIIAKEKISDAQINVVNALIKTHNINRAYIGVPSNDNEAPFQIASSLDIPCTIAYEYMFKPAKHTLWNYVEKLASKEGLNFAVPLSPARDDILAINPTAVVHEIGHLSLDAVPVSKPDLTKDEEMVFVSGTSQPTEVDNQFLQSLLTELSTGKYPGLQVRMGIHPGVKDPDLYLQTLLKTCATFPSTTAQFKIILTPQMETKLKLPVMESPFILRANISGPDLAQSATRITQAVPGALLNTAAFKGKPSYYHDQSTLSYLPKNWFSDNIATFFTTKPQSAHTKAELGLVDSAPNLLAKLLVR